MLITIQLSHCFSSYPEKKVLYKKYIGNATYGQVSFFLTVLSVFNTVFLWPFVVVFYFTGFEVIEWDKIPWDYLCGNAALGVGKCLFARCHTKVSVTLTLTLSITTSEQRSFGTMTLMLYSETDPSEQ